jgi:cytosine/adenosine deaminase-related metal-dependent hydrolase
MPNASRLSSSKSECRVPNGADEASGKTLLRAAWVAPMDGPPIRDGAIVFDRGVILQVGSADSLTKLHPDAHLVERPDETILPGLVNAHTHLELSEYACGQAPGDFVEWLMRLVPRGPLNLEAIHKSVAQSVPIGVGQCLRFGVTCVGDISRHSGVSRPLLRDGPLRVVSYGEIQAMAKRRGLLEERIEAATDRRFDSEFLRTALTPHAPYSVEIAGYRRCLEVARSRALPLATHLAETTFEAPFLESHSGRFRDLWEYLGAWDDGVPRFGGGPIRLAASIGLLNYPRSLLAHVNYCDDSEMDLLAGGRASVVYCPRTHAYFGHPPHRWREMLARGINVAVGTDSCASSPDLNLVDELRLLRRLAPEIPALELWKMATVNAARALDMQAWIGALRPGLAADLVAFKSAAAEPLEEILNSAAPPAQVWIGGRQIDPATANTSRR